MNRPGGQWLRLLREGHRQLSHSKSLRPDSDVAMGFRYQFDGRLIEAIDDRDAGALEAVHVL